MDGVSVTDHHPGRSTGAAPMAHDIALPGRTEESQRFLARASAAFASSLDYRETLASLARLAGPKIADWCGVCMLPENGELEAAIAHVEPEKARWATEIHRRYPPDPHAPHGVYHVLQTGRCEFAARVTDEQLAAAARDIEHLELLAELGVKSYIIAPFSARGQTFVAIAFVSAQSERPYGPADVALAEELANRAAPFIDTARLYRVARQLIQELEQLVVSRTIELQQANQRLAAQGKGCVA